MTRRLLAATALLGLGLALGSCSSVAGSVADHWPYWAGGMPNDVPPRPGAPGYDEFIAHGQAKHDATTPATTGKTETPAAPSGNRAPNEAAATQGGLY